MMPMNDDGRTFRLLWFSDIPFFQLINFGILSVSKAIPTKVPCNWVQRPIHSTRRRNHFTLKVKGLWMIAQRAVLFLFLFGTHHFCLPGKARDRFIRWRKSGRNNNGSSNQQQCLLFVRLHTQSVPSEAVIVNLWWQKETLCVRRFHTLCIRVRARVRAQCFCNFINWISFTTWDFAKWHTFAIQEPRGQRVNKKESEGEWLGGTSKRILSFPCEKKKLKVVLNVSYGKQCYQF